MTTSEEVLEPTLTHSNRLRMVTVKLADFNGEYTDWAVRYKHLMTKQHRNDFVDLLKRQLDMIEELAEAVDDIGRDLIAIGEHQRDTYADMLRQLREVTESETDVS